MKINPAGVCTRRRLRGEWSANPNPKGSRSKERQGAEGTEHADLRASRRVLVRAQREAAAAGGDHPTGVKPEPMKSRREGRGVRRRATGGGVVQASGPRLLEADVGPSQHHEAACSKSSSLSHGAPPGKCGEPPGRQERCGVRRVSEARSRYVFWRPILQHVRSCETHTG